MTLVATLTNCADAGLPTNKQETEHSQQRKEKVMALPHALPLSELTRTQESLQHYPCIDSRLTPIYDKNTEIEQPSNSFRIPLIIHQTSKSRCLFPKLKATAESWRNLTGFEYYFHDDVAVDHFIFNCTHPEFPMLPLIVRNCINSGATKADIWRLLVLWHYGGVYVDIDSAPGAFSSKMLNPQDDAFLLVDKDGLPSQYFIAVKPRHPLIFIALTSALSAVLQVDDTLFYNPVQITGPGMLRGAFDAYVRWSGRPSPLVRTTQRVISVKAGIYQGLGNTTVRLAGYAENPDVAVVREKFHNSLKYRWYRIMNMSHFKFQMKRKSGRSCQKVILEDLEPSRTAKQA
jgi:mannosyltransferase OCH1-like enzyme